MLTLTRDAAGVVDTVRQHQGVPEDFGLRVTPKQTPDGTQIELAFAAEPASDDHVTETEGTKLFVAEEIADSLSGAVIDAQETPEGPALVLRSGANDGQG